MKIRTGFVSNSSSSSFTCDICKETAVDYDGECEIEYLSCENGHEICCKHLKNRGKLSVEKMREDLLKDVDQWENAGPDEVAREKDLINGMNREDLEEAHSDVFCGEELTEESCPLCSFQTLTDEDVLEYLLMLVGSTKKRIVEQALKSYKDYDAFCDALKNHKKEIKGKK